MAGNGSSSSNSSGNGTRTDTNINNGNWLGFSLSPNNNSNSSSMEIMQMELLPNNSTSHHNNYHSHPHHSNFDHQSQTCSTTSTAAAVAFIPSSVPPPTSMFLTPLNHQFNPSSNGNGGGAGQYSCFVQGRGGTSLGEISGSTSFHLENHYPSSQQLAVMPIKSDGSLCIMEALTRSSQPPPQGMMMVQSNASPKLENFFEGRGGATQHHSHNPYHQDERDHQVAMALSLDSIYYHHHQNQHEAQQEHNRNHHHYPVSLEIFQQPTTTTTYFSSAVPCSQSSLITQSPHHTSMVGGDQQIKVDHTHTHQTISDCDAQQMANWISTHHQQAGGAAMGMGVSEHHRQHNFGDANSNSNNTNSNNNFITENGGDQSSSSSICCGDLQSLRLSMSPGSQSSISITTTTPNAHNLTCSSSNENDQSAAVVEMATGKKRAHQPASSSKQPVNHRKSIDTFGQRTSQYRGVTKHRWTGRYEAHLWDNSCKKEGQTRKGRQVYLGGYDMEEKAARAYDLAALKYWGPSTHINFPIENYKEEVEEMKSMTRQEYVAHLRRKSSGFSRGASMYRGVTRHHQHGRWQARIGRVAGNKDLYLGTFSTQEEAAEAYDIAAIKFRGINAVTNFNITRYDVDKIMDSNTLLAGEQAKKIPSPPPPLLLNPPPPPTAIDPTNTMTTNQTAINPSPSSTPSPTDWTKMVLNDYHHHYQNHHHQPQPDAGQCMGKNEDGDIGINGIGIRTPNPNWDRFMGLEPLNSTHQQQQQQAATTSVLGAAVDETSNKVGSVQFSNASSIVTSLNSSREGSPCRSGSSPNNNNNMNGLIIRPSPPIAWIPSSAQLRPPHPSAAAAVAISMAHNMPVFAAWGDA